MKTETQIHVDEMNAQLLENEFRYERNAVRDALHLARDASTAQVLTEIGAMKDRLRAVAQRRRRQRLIDRQKLVSA